jgi:hypothetical protein
MFLACLISAPALAASGVMIKDDSLRASAESSAASVGHVAKGASVEVLARQGGWTEIAEGGHRGWVRILAVRVAPSASGDGLSGILQAGTRRSDSSRVVAVAGMRGLNEEELKAAHYDAREIQELDRFTEDHASAENFARSAGLRHRDLAYLPAPQSEPRQQRNSPWGESGLP